MTPSTFCSTSYYSHYQKCWKCMRNQAIIISFYLKLFLLVRQNVIHKFTWQPVYLGKNVCMYSRVLTLTFYDAFYEDLLDILGGPLHVYNFNNDVAFWITKDKMIFSIIKKFLIKGAARVNIPYHFFITFIMILSSDVSGKDTKIIIRN